MQTKGLIEAAANPEEGLHLVASCGAIISEQVNSVNDCKLLAASWNSYQRNCVDPLEAAEGDLLGEALVALVHAAPYFRELGLTETSAYQAIQKVLSSYKLTKPSTP